MDDSTKDVEGAQPHVEYKDETEHTRQQQQQPPSSTDDAAAAVSAAAASAVAQFAKLLNKNPHTGGYKILDDTKALSRDLAARAADTRDAAVAKLGMTPDDLDKIHAVPAVVALAGILINLLLLFSRYQNAWVKGYARVDGRTYEAFVSLLTVELGEEGEFTYALRDAGTGCGWDNYCSLSTLCDFEPPADAAHDFTPREAWCQLKQAGELAQELLWLGFLPGVGTCLLTLLYAAREVSRVQTSLASAASKGVSSNFQKVAVVTSWLLLWVFLFAAMVLYAVELPDSLGLGLVKLESSFGVVRLSFMLVSIFGAILAASVFELWRTENVVEAWTEFAETPLFSSKKALYLLLMFQLGCYLAMFVDDVQWEMLMPIICAYYVDAKVRNFMILYVVLTVSSILFDVVQLCFMPTNWETYTPGESFTNGLFLTVLMCKVLILGTIYLYEKDPASQENAWRQFPPEQLGVGDRDDEIAE